MKFNAPVMNSLTISVFVLSLVVMSCQKNKKIGPATAFDDKPFLSMTPTSDGGMYAVNFKSGLWYFRGAEAVKVSIPIQFENEKERCKFHYCLKIAPLTDGGAYAYSEQHDGIWFLKDGCVKKVGQVGAITTKANFGSGDWFAPYIQERKRRIEAEEEVEELENPPQEPPEQR